MYKDSEIVNDELRKKSPYYKDYLLANNLPYVAGISIHLKSNYHMIFREMEMIFGGKFNEEIAAELMISESTIKKHVSHIYEKLELSRRPQLIQFVLDNDMAHLWEKED